MEVRAELNNLRIAPRKIRSFSAGLKGMAVARAKSQLEHLTKRAGRPLAKLLDSALANAQNNFGLVKENMYIKQLIVNEGPKLKRFRPKGFGSTSPIEKKTSHIRVILEERVAGLKASKPLDKKSDEGTGDAKRQAAQRTGQFRHGDGEIKQPGIFGQFKGVRKLFRRKAI